MSIVCLDTHIVIWGIKKEASDGQENLILQAENFLKWLDENKKKIMEILFNAVASAPPDIVVE